MNLPPRSSVSYKLSIIGYITSKTAEILQAGLIKLDNDDEDHRKWVCDLGDLRGRGFMASRCFREAKRFQRRCTSIILSLGFSTN